MKIGHKKNSFRYFGYLNCKGKIPLCFFIHSKIKEFIITNTNCYRAGIFRFAVLGYVVTAGQVAGGILTAKDIGHLMTGKDINGNPLSEVDKRAIISSLAIEGSMLAVSSFTKLKLKYANKVEVIKGGENFANTVWDNIKVTQPFYGGTKIPKSFELKVNGEKFWVHPNGTKHMVEYITKYPMSHGMPINSQTLLSSFQNSVSDAVKQGIRYDEIINIRKWEHIFSKLRGETFLPVRKQVVYKP